MSAETFLLLTLLAHRACSRLFTVNVMYNLLIMQHVAPQLLRAEPIAVYFPCNVSTFRGFVNLKVQ